MLYIVTAVHNRLYITSKFVEQLLSQSFQNYTLLVIDDGSSDGTSEMVKTMCPNSIVLYGKGNLWWGGAMDKALRYLSGIIKDDDIIMFANDDTEFSDDYLEKAQNLLDYYPECLLSGCGVSKQSGKQIDGALIFDCKTGCEELLVEGGVTFGNCASTRSLFLRGELVKKTGYFHPIILPHYGSDYEWTIRACRVNKTSVVCDSNLTYFANENTSGYHSFKTQSFKQIFSKKSNCNPFYRFSFYLLTAPKGKKLSSSFAQIKRLITYYKQK